MSAIVRPRRIPLNYNQQLQQQSRARYRVKRSRIAHSQLFLDKALPAVAMINTNNDCIEISWKAVFEHAVYGTPSNFCTRRKTLQSGKLLQ
jgi:hypothetical protein